MTNFLAQHRAAFFDALRRLAAAPLGGALSLIVIGIALSLPGIGYLVLENLRAAVGNASGVQQVSIFMAIDASSKDLGEIESRLRELAPGPWRLVSREDALKRLQGTQGMAEIVASLPRNPLPDAFVVEPADARGPALENLAKTFSAWPKVAHVQLDSAWVKRLDAFLRIGKLAVLLVSGLFAAALAAVTFNTIRLQIMAQRAEIEVMKLIGATDAFIRRPFDYFGAIQGAIGALIAALIVNGTVWLLAEPIGELVSLYSGSFVMHGLTLASFAALVALGSALGWIGARLSVAIHLRRIGQGL